MTTDHVRSEITIAAPLSRIVEVLADVESYPSWAKAVRATEVLSRDAQGRPEHVRFDLAPGPLPRVTYTLHYNYADNEISWDYVEGDLLDLSGAYHFESVDSGTVVAYELTVDPGTAALPGFVKARAAREITKVALADLKRKIEG